MLELMIVLVMTHVTIASVTIFLHRSQAHRAVELHPAISHFMRFWLWMTTGMVTKEWVAIHRKHHQACETRQDPHSPQVHGILKVLFAGAWLYANATRNRKMIEQFGKGTPDDWAERNVYSRHPNMGYLSLLVILTLLFNGWGILMWLVQVAWIPFWAAGVVNGVGHWWGYRNVETKDCSRNISPIGVWIGGEELHSNHHANPGSAKLSMKWWEFDIGYFYIRRLEELGLARNVKVANS